MNLLDLLTGCWAIQPAKLLELQAVYATHLRGDKIDIAGIEARLGRPLHNEQQLYSVQEGGVGVLPISGVIAPKANLFMQISGGLSTQMATKQLESMVVDPRVRSIVLAIDSPGGSVIGTPELAAVVRKLAAETPIVALSDGTMASAAYWIGSAANALYITGPTIEVGSIGVVAVHDFNPRAAETRTEITAGRYKRIASSNAPLSDEGRAHIQADVDHVYSLFVDAVAENRSATSQQVLEHMADGRVFRGQRAIDAGLVDGVSTLDDLVEQLATKPAAFATRRKAVFAVAGNPAKPAGAQAGISTEPVPLATQPATQGDPMDRATLAQQHPTLLAQIQAEGADAERARIQAVLAVGEGLPGHEKLLNALAYDGKTTAGDAATAVLAAEKAARQAAINAHRNDAPAAGKSSPAPKDGPAKDKHAQLAEARAYMAQHPGIDLVAALKALGYYS